VGKHPLLYKALRFTLLAVIWGTMVLGLAIVYFIASVPDPIIAALDDRPPNVTILAEDGTVLAERGLRRGHVRLDVLPPYLAKAVIATEDRRFYHHFGIDPLGLVRASFRNASAGTVVEGGSTITQQLQESVPLAQAHHDAEARGGDLRDLARAALHQGRDPRALSQPRLFRRRHVRHRGGGAALFRQVGALSHPSSGGAARRPPQGAVQIRADAEREACHGPRR
jgi:hypothetical protein